MSGASVTPEVLSETDFEGRITFVSEGFLRASGFAEADLLGRPHSITRHPDMPRSIFGQLWQKLRAGEEVFLYVQNRTKAGGGYWELVHATPRFDSGGAAAGYRSVRRPADAEEVAQIEPFYRRIRQMEIDAEAAAGLPPAGDGAVAA